MGAVYNQVKGRMAFPLMEVWRHSQDIIHRFKQAQNAVLFAAGSCWEAVSYTHLLGNIQPKAAAAAVPVS